MAHERRRANRLVRATGMRGSPARASGWEYTVTSPPRICGGAALPVADHSLQVARTAAGNPHQPARCGPYHAPRFHRHRPCAHPGHSRTAGKHAFFIHGSRRASCDTSSRRSSTTAARPSRRWTSCSPPDTRAPILAWQASPARVPRTRATRLPRSGASAPAPRPRACSPACSAMRAAARRRRRRRVRWTAMSLPCGPIRRTMPGVPPA